MKIRIKTAFASTRFILAHREVTMKNMGFLAKFILGLGLTGMLLGGNLQTAYAKPRSQETTPPESRVLDLAAEALGWAERTSGRVYISHLVKSGEVTLSSGIRWEIFPVSYFVYAGNKPGTAFGETQGYHWGSGCSVAGGCNPPTYSHYFQFNFDMNRDGDNNIDTPAGQYLGFFCEVTVIAPEAQIYDPADDVGALCTKVLEKAVEVRESLEIPACVGVVCPSSKCEGDIRYSGGTCDPKTGQCSYPSSEDCGSNGCNIGTGECNPPEAENLCEGVTCDPAYCEENISYSEPACDPGDGMCGYFKKQECGTAGCNAETGRCYASAPGACGGLAPLMLVPLALIVRRPGRKKVA
jgi:hypothetical protein